MKTKTKAIVWTSAGLLTAAVLAAVVLHFYNFVGLLPYSKNAETLDLHKRLLFSAQELYEFENLKSVDLRGKRVINDEEVEKLREAYPGIYVRWDIKIGEKYYDSESTSIVIENIQLGEINKLKLFKNLESVGIKGVRYSDELAQALSEYENLSFAWEIDICGVKVMSDADSVDLSGRKVSADAVIGDLEQLKNLTQVNLRDCGLTAEDLAKIRESYPGVLLTARVKVGEAEIDTGASEFTVPKGMNSDELSTVVLLSKNLKKVRAKSCGLAEDELKAVADKFPEVLFVWDTQLQGSTFSTDAEEIDISGKRVGNFADFKKDISYFRALEKIDMCDCGLSNEKMEELCNTYKNTKFVWKVRVGCWAIRTDAVAFSTAYPISYKPTADTKRDEKGIIKISTADLQNIKYCTDLEALDLGHRGLTDITVLGNLKKLKILIIADNNITDISVLKNLENLIYAELFMNGISDFSPLLASKNTLLDLNICWNRVKDISVLEQFDKLERLWMAGNPVSHKPKEIKKLRAKLPNCLINHTQGESTGDGWRRHERYYWMRDYFGLFYMS